MTRDVKIRMRDGRDQLHRFLRAAHRRWVVWRAIEQMGLCVLAGSALAVPLIGVLWFREQSSIPLVMTILGASALVGGVIGLFRRPSLLDTAIEADRQLELHDLLSSALALPNCRYLDDSWRSTIQRLAEARCAQISPSQLVLRRLGSRAWGGIGLSAALVLTLGLMTTTPLSTSARTGARSQAGALPDPHPGGALAQRSDSMAMRRDPPQPSRRDLGSTNMSDAGSAAPPDAGTESEAGSLATPDSDGHGGAAAQTKQRTHPPQPPRFDSAGSLSSATDSPDAPSATGGTPDRDSLMSDRTELAPPTGTADRMPQRVAAPWRSNTWERDRAAAMESLRSGQIPDRYRDLVRAYFDAEHD